MKERKKKKNIKRTKERNESWRKRHLGKILAVHRNKNVKTHELHLCK
jgi:hypothetical protein